MYVNNFHHSIKFIFEYSDTSVPFLDVLVRIKNNSISTSLYNKPTDSHVYLNFNSRHPTNLKKSVIYSQCLRIKRIRYDLLVYDRLEGKLINHFLCSDYPLKVIKEATFKASKVDIINF